MIVGLAKIDDQFSIGGVFEVILDGFGGFGGESSGTIQIEVVCRLTRGSESSFGEISGGEIGNIAIRDKDVAVSGGISGGIVVFETQSGTRDGGVDTEFLENFERNGGTAEAGFTVEKAVFGSVEAKVEPFGAEFVGFEVFGARVEI